jgi:replicative DNA helicase
VATPLPRVEGRVPPHDLEAEASVLGAILLEPMAIARVLELVVPEDFYRENNAQIFRAATDLFREGEPIDNVTLAAQLEKMGVLERVGGRAHLAMLQEQTPTAANVEHYARIVKARAYKRSLITAGGQVSALGYDDSVDAEEAINQAQSHVYAIAEHRVGTGMERLYDLLKPAMDKIDAQMASGGGVVGIASGFHDLDRVTNGFKASDMVVIAGRPSMGKTSFVLNVTLNAAVEQKQPVAIFSLEMSKEQLVERMLCEQARIDAQRLHRGLLSEAEHERLVYALGPLGDAPIFIDDSPMLDDLTLRLKARQAKARDAIELVIVDYLQLMHGRVRGDDGNRVQEVSQISRSMKAIARELRVPVIAISQLSRAPEARPDKRPILSDLRESGCLAGDSLVYLPDEGRHRRLDELVGRTGYRVLALDPESRNLERRVVTNSFGTGRKPVRRLRTSSDRTIRATANHKFLAVSGWKRLDELGPGDHVALPGREGPSAGEWTLGARRKGPSVGERTSSVCWDRIVSVEADGEEDVYDLTVEGLHNFVANDIILHNSIEQDADLVMFLYRDEYYNREKSEKQGIAEILVAKHRNGPTGSVELAFRKELTRFENLDRRRAEVETAEP